MAVYGTQYQYFTRWCGNICNVWWDLNNHLTANFLENLTVKEFSKLAIIWQYCGHRFGAKFLAHHV